jgi:hypothetical protein
MRASYRRKRPFGRLVATQTNVEAGRGPIFLLFLEFPLSVLKFYLFRLSSLPTKFAPYLSRRVRFR